MNTHSGKKQRFIGGGRPCLYLVSPVFQSLPAGSVIQLSVIIHTFTFHGLFPADKLVQYFQGFCFRPEITLCRLPGGLPSPVSEQPPDNVKPCLYRLCVRFRFCKRQKFPIL